MSARVVYVQTQCFPEKGAAIGPPRRVLAEGVGTLLLLAAAAGSGEAFRGLVPEAPAFSLLATAIAMAVRTTL